MVSQCASWRRCLSVTDHVEDVCCKLVSRPSWEGEERHVELDDRASCRRTCRHSRVTTCCHGHVVPSGDGRLFHTRGGEDRREGWGDTGGFGLEEDRFSFCWGQALEPILRCGGGEMRQIGVPFLRGNKGVTHGDSFITAGTEGVSFFHGVEGLDIIGINSIPSWDKENSHRWCSGASGVGRFFDKCCVVLSELWRETVRSLG